MIEISRPPRIEKVVLTALQTPVMDKELFEEDVQEMLLLLKTAGAVVVDVIIQKLQRIQPATYLGSGKLAEIRSCMKSHDCASLVIDAELSPSQIKKIEEIIGGKVIDRNQLILDIFAKHAQTNESRIQVELAQLRTLYPRLTHAWSHFSQQVGGIGTTGPGEKQLEVDRRLIQKKITELKRKLKKIESSRSTQRKKRKTAIQIALIGYTNVGKSSILNSLCKSSVLVEDKLFATLETATRKLHIPDLGTVVLSDTVGFLRKLPIHLVASFKSTLEVVRDADLLLIVMDATSSWADSQLATVNSVLEQLSISVPFRLMVFNKADLVPNPFQRKEISLRYPDSILVSAFNEHDMQMLKTKVASVIRSCI